MPTIKYIRLLVLQAVFIAGIATAFAAEDKNGVSPNTVSLPSGPGSIEGLGEAFQPMLNTGTARYEVNLSLPPGVAGNTPMLALQYESGSGDGPLGIGWSFGPGSISRQVDKGVPRYVDGPNGADDDHDGEIDEPDEVDRFIGLEGEELVQLDDGSFRARIEGSFARYRRVGDYWVVHLKNGTMLELGLTSQARDTDASGNLVFRWLLEKSTDVSGNVTAYEYSAPAAFENRKYFKEVRYGPGPGPWPVYYFVSCAYEPRPDPRTDYRSGYRVTTGMRLIRIDIGIQGHLPDQCAPGDWNNDGVADALIRSYRLGYDEARPHFSFLSRVSQYGADNESYLPPLSFDYSAFSPAPVISAAGAVITSPDAPPIVMDNPLVELIDLNRDGLPDILRTDRFGGSHTGYINRGPDDSGSAHQIQWDGHLLVTSPDDLAAEMHLVEDEVHLADMDGDGLSDLIHTTLTNEVFYHTNMGDGTWGPRRQMSIQHGPPPAPFADENAETVDLNFDKRMDVVKSTEAGYSVWFSLGDDTYSREVRTAGAVYRGSVMQLSLSGVHLADMNGDRMSDVVRIGSAQIVCCPSMGHGRFDTAVEIPIPDIMLTDGKGGQISKARLKDVNGDGLSDLVLERAAPGELWYWLNQGTGELSSRHVITGMPHDFSQNSVTRWADLNGNGTTDLIYADSGISMRLRAIDIGELTGGSAHPNLLNGIDNGLGVYTAIEYQSSTDYYRRARDAGRPWSSTVPFPVSVIARVWTMTGQDLDSLPGFDEYIKTYTYRDGFYEDREKAFRGFEEVTVVEPGDETAPAGVTVRRFFTGGPDGVDNDGDGLIDEDSARRHREEDALKGMVKSVSVQADNGTIFSEERSSWQVRTLAESIDGIEMRLSCRTREDRLIYEGGSAPQEIVRNDYEYDDFGNITEQTSFGALGIDGDESFIFTEYINDSGRWLIGLPSRELVTDYSSQKYSETLSFYDGQDFTGLPAGQAEKGLLTRQQGWVSGDNYVNLMRSRYDAYGNVVESLDPLGSSRAITYDSILNTYPVREDIEVGSGKPDLAVSAEYSLGLGTVTGSIGFNGHETTYGHDCFGRLTSIVGPGDSSELPTVSFTYTLTDPAKKLIYYYNAAGELTLHSGIAAPCSVSTRSREVSGSFETHDTTQFVDGLGRSLALYEEAEQGFAVKNAVLFNARAAVSTKFVPYSTGAGLYVRPQDDAPAVKIRYDAAGRATVHISPPDGLGAVSTVTTQYAPLARSETDENGNSKQYISDGLERLTEVHEHNDSDTYITNYGYDASDNLIRVTDALGNIKTMTCDGLGRRTELSDPDRGRTLYQYDNVGRLTESMDNKGQLISYTYDAPGRMLTVDYLDGRGKSPDITYHYDQPSADYPAMLNTGGRLAWIEDLSGGLFISYDDRGNIARSVKRIAFNGSVSDYSSFCHTDAMGRVTEAVYPDGDRVSYLYNNGARLESIPGILGRIDYTPAGKLHEIEYANGLQTSYSYDPRLRLSSLHTDTPAGTGSPLQNLSYGFDEARNITSIDDNRALPPGSPLDATQAFEYDDLYRLSAAAGPGYGRIEFQHDEIGNMVYKSSPASGGQHISDPLINLGIIESGGAGGSSGRGVRLPGDPPGPHAITGTQSGLSYLYDDNGNVVSRSGDAYEWDFNDRLVRTVTDNATTRYVYDYAGQRVIKSSRRGGDETTVYYVSDVFELRGDLPVKYVFDGSRRVARIEGRRSQSGDPDTQRLHFYQGWNFFSLDVEPYDPEINTVLAAASGQYNELWTYDSAAQQYLGHVPSEAVADLTELHAQTGYVIHVTEPVALEVSGIRTAGDLSLHPGWNLIACPADCIIPVEDALTSVAGLYDEVWEYESLSGEWLAALNGTPQFLNNLDNMVPGRAYWVKISDAAVLGYHQQTRHAYFYHTDQLGSSSLVTDESGTVVERTEFYPFGRHRYEERTGFNSAYKFTGKELDKETGLQYFEARYYDAVAGRFISVDPLYTETGEAQDNPQALGTYTYALNSPVCLVDPLGLDSSATGFIKGLKAVADAFETGENAGKAMLGINSNQKRSIISGGISALLGLGTAVTKNKFISGLGHFKNGVDVGVAVHEGNWGDALSSGVSGTGMVLLESKNPMAMAFGGAMVGGSFSGDLLWEAHKKFISDGSELRDSWDPMKRYARSGGFSSPKRPNLSSLAPPLKMDNVIVLKPVVLKMTAKQRGEMHQAKRRAAYLKRGEATRQRNLAWMERKREAMAKAAWSKATRTHTDDD